jgi:hypothetical protein
MSGMNLATSCRPEPLNRDHYYLYMLPLPGTSTGTLPSQTAVIVYDYAGLGQRDLRAKLLVVCGSFST